MLTREVKTRRESIEAFRRAAARTSPTRNRPRIAILQEFLPQALTDDELEALVDEAVAATGATSARDMGKVMGWLSPRTRGRADGAPRQRARRAALAAADLAGHAHGAPGGRDGLTMLTQRPERGA